MFQFPLGKATGPSYPKMPTRLNCSLEALPRTKPVQGAAPGRVRGEHRVHGLTRKVTEMVKTACGNPPPIHAWPQVVPVACISLSPLILQDWQLQLNFPREKQSLHLDGVCLHHLQTVGPRVPLAKTHESIPNIPLVQQRQNTRDESTGWVVQGRVLALRTMAGKTGTEQDRCQEVERGQAGTGS